MNVLLLNQCFYPDVMATAQQLTDLALGLAKEGHRVTVLTSDRGYDDPGQSFPRRETWNGIEIIRLSSLSLGKETRWRRAANFGSFLINCALKLRTLPRFDTVVALTSPPLISLLGSLFVRRKGGKFFFWVMDLNPDEAIAAGWLKEHSVPARVLRRLLRYSLLRAEKVIALDHFMKQRIVAKGVDPERVVVLPPWAYDDTVSYDEGGRTAFRARHNLAEKFVVMYAGNHSPCHPLDTLLEAARRLSEGAARRTDIVFCFVGGGSEQKKVREFAARHNLENIRCLPYQPFDMLAASLSAADLHTIVMGDNFVGIVHPCKLYNILAIGSPFLYIGPAESHISEIAGRTKDSYGAYSAKTGDVDAVVNHILDEATRTPRRARLPVSEIANAFSRTTLLPRLISLIQMPAVTESQTSPQRARRNTEMNKKEIGQSAS
ncbi:MAG: glycosyltransferase family 4 protein [Pyrinomonadaceae bacterium]|nr:glycosyltransferase family 4 protein [Pyrinomonadaceae bacterium]